MALALSCALVWLWRTNFDPQAALAWLAERRAWVGAHRVQAAGAYFAAYVTFAALSLPGAWAMSVAGGALFGSWAGPPLVSVSSTAGATLAMLAARHLFRGAIAARFPALVAGIDRGVAQQGARWLFAARLTPFSRPRTFDYNLVVIGAGSAGLVAAYVAAAAGARVALVERGEMGGDCLNTGCVPSRALLRAAKIAHESRTASRFGFSGALKADFPAMMARVHATVAKVAPHDSAERYRALGVEVIAGEARVVGPWTVEVGARVLTARRMVIATGAEPALPPIPGLAEVAPLTSATVWRLENLPQRLLILGGGAVGCEFAQAFARLGAQVCLVEAAPACSHARTKTSRRRWPRRCARRASRLSRARRRRISRPAWRGSPTGGRSRSTGC